MKLYKFTIASIKMFFRNKQGLFWSLVLPLMIMVIFGLIDFEKFGTTKIGVVDQANNQASSQLIQSLQKIDIIKIDQGNLDEEKTVLEKGNRDLVLVLPSDYGNFVSGTTPMGQPIYKPISLQIFLNQGRAQQAQAGLTVLNQVFDGLSHNITQTPQLFTFSTENVSSRNLKYIDFLVPGIIALSVMQLGIFSIIFAIVTFREKGIMRRLVVTPIKPFEFIGGQVVTRMIVSLVQIAVIMLTAILLFKIHIYGSIPLMILLIMIGSILFISLGLAISGLATTEETAAPIANLLVFPQMFLGNVFFPVSSMPDWLQRIVKYLPLNYLADGLRKISTEGAHLLDIKYDLYGLLVWTGIAVFLATIFFRWKERE